MIYHSASSELRNLFTVKFSAVKVMNSESNELSGNENND